MPRYTVYIIPQAWIAIKYLPGNIRRRIKNSIDDLVKNPRPSKSKKLEILKPEFPLEIRRLRLENWRIIYAISEADKAIDILAVKKRPPYDYEDLEKLLEKLL